MSASATAALAVPKHIQGRTVIANLPKKLAKRAVLAQNHAARARKRAEEVEQSLLRRQYITQQKRINSMTRTRVRNERAWRREDWVKGPLAPKRDFGQHAETFGALSAMEIRALEKPKVMLSGKEHGIVVGDRVCVVRKGLRETGRIGKVKEVRKDAEDCTLEGMNQTEVAVPEYMLVKETDKSKVRLFERPFALEDVRLVVPLPDPETGKLRDHVINELSFEKITKRERKGLDPPTRFITNLDPPQYIPYPEKANEDTEEYDIDTLRIEVDEKTWVPTLHMPPMPEQVVDELRNKFSTFRFKHDDEYVAKLAKEDRKKLRKERSVAMMMTPLKQARKVERKERQALGRPELDEQDLARIGEFMERKLQGASIDANNTPSPSLAPSP